MTTRQRADASNYYRSATSADLARFDSSAVCGNLADAMKNATVLLPPPKVDHPVELMDSVILEDEAPTE